MAVGKAIQQLELEGLLISQGNRRPRLIAEGTHKKSASLKLGMLFYDADNALRYDALAIKQELIHACHKVITAPNSMNVDAWAIYAGSRPIWEWFEQQDKPAFALHGRHNKVSLASIGINKSSVIAELIGKLNDFGHKRIVMLAREERRKPQLGMLE